MANYTLSAKITANASEYVNEFKKVKSETETAKKGLEGTGKSVSKAGGDIMKAGAAVTLATAPIAAFGKQAFETGRGFQSSMAKVKGLMGDITDGEFEDLKNAALEMGSETRHSASASADALGYMALAGWDAEQSIVALPGVLNLATASGMDLAKSSDVMTDMMSMFSIEAEDASLVADMFAKAQSSANYSVDQLSEALINVGPSAAMVGDSIEGTSAAIGILANNGIKGGKAGTYLNAMYRDLQKNAEDGAVAVGDTSVAVYDSEGAFRGLGSIIADVEDATAGMSDEQRAAALSSIFQDQAMKGLNTMLKNGTGSLRELEAELMDSKGAGEDFANIVDDTMDGAMLGLASRIEKLQLRFYDLMDKYLRPLIIQFSEFVNKLADMSDGTLLVVSAIGAFLIILGPVLIIIGALTKLGGYMMIGIEKVTAGFALLGKGLTFLVSPIGIVIAVIAALAALFIYLWNTNEAFREGVIAIWEAIAAFFAEIWEAITGFFSAAMEKISVMLEGPVAKIKELWNAMPEFFVGLWEFISMIFTESLNFIIETFRGPIEAIKELWNALQPFFSLFWEILKTMFITGIESIKHHFVVFSEFFKNLFNTLLDVGKVWVQSFAKIIEGIINIVTGILEIVVGIFTNNFDLISTGFSKVVDGFKKGFGTFKDITVAIGIGINENFANVMSTLAGVLNGLFKNINGAIGIINKIPNVNIPLIPMLARGTDDFQGGLARINEGGRGELVSLPSGAQVIPHDISKTYARESARVNRLGSDTGGGDAYTSVIKVEGNTFTIREEADIRKTAQALQKLIDRDRRG